tara:strand:- start:2096 stop:2998 length:903 start_codon:yes stop_codon:yes gene_type:complete
MGRRTTGFSGFTGSSNKKPPTKVNPPGTSSPSFSGYSAPKRPDSSGGTSPGSGYTPGGDSYKNYSDEDQNIMFNQAGGKDKFLNQVANVEQKYKRSADVQNYLNKAKQYFNAQSLGATASNTGGIERLNFTTPGMPVMRDAQGNQMLSMMRPELTAQAPTTAQFFGDMAGGVGNLLGAAGEFITGGGALGRILDSVKTKFSEGKDFVQDAFNPGNINQRVNALSPEQQRIYAMYMNQGMPYQQAFQMASGQQFDDTPATYYNNSPISTLKLGQGQNSPQGAFPGGFKLTNMAMGGIANLN